MHPTCFGQPSRAKFLRTPEISNKRRGHARKHQAYSLPGLALPETVTTPSRADFQKLADIAPIEARRSKTPGPLVPPFSVRPPKGAGPNHTSGRRTNPIPHKKQSSSNRLSRQEPGAQVGWSVRSQIRGSFAGDSAILE